MKPKLVVYNHGTGKIFRIHYLDGLFGSLWGNKDFMTASGLDKSDYSQTIFDNSVSVDIISDTVNVDGNLVKPDTSVIAHMTGNKVQGIFDQNI